MESENFTKMLDDLKNRFASRFIFSFIIAWLIYHWQISVALFWYDKTQFQAEGCRSIFDFISNQLKSNSYNCETFWTAIGFTFGLPITKSIINIYDDVILAIRRWIKAKILKNALTKEIKRLKDILKKIDDKSFMNGKWNFKIEQRDLKDLSSKINKKVDVNEYELNINDAKITSKLKNNGESEVDKYIITDFYYNEDLNKIYFKKELMSNFINDKNDFLQNIKISFLDIEKDSSGRIKLTGQENHDYVEYLKIEI